MNEYVPWNSRPLEEWREKYAQGNFVDLDGRSTHYIETGAGEPLILIHGFNMDLNTWMNNIESLAKQHKVYALDLWGLGFSSRQPLDYGYNLFVEQLTLFMDSLEIQKATLVGHSMGGGTAMVFTLRHPERVNKLVLVDATGIPDQLPLRAKIFNLPRVGEYLLGVNNDFLRKKNLKEIWLYNEATLTEERYQTVSQFQKVKGTSEVLLEILRKEFFHTLGSEIYQLGQVEVPTLIVWGSRDASISLDVGRELHRRLRGSTFRVIDGAGHMPNFECPDEFNQLVLDFLIPVVEGGVASPVL